MKITSGASAGVLKYILTVFIINFEVDNITNAKE